MRRTFTVLLGLRDRPQLHAAVALIQAKVATIRCKKSDMRDAETASSADGCLTVLANSRCLVCSANR